MERTFKGVWIPSELWLKTDLTLIEKVFLVEISSLDGEKGCYASNSHFAEFFRLSNTRCSTIINTLKSKGYINIRNYYENGNKTMERRIININEDKISKTASVKNNTVEESIRKVRAERSSIEVKCSESEELEIKEEGTREESTEDEAKKVIYEKVIRYLNEKCKSKYKATTIKNQKCINARITEGYNVEDFKRVVDKKCEEWLEDNYMKKYLRPETLFGTKFERYLNEIEMNVDNSVVNNLNGKGGQAYGGQFKNFRNSRENEKSITVKKPSKWSQGNNTENRSLTPEEREWAERELF